jgi:hypothetical protein
MAAEPSVDLVECFRLGGGSGVSVEYWMWMFVLALV